MTELTEQEHNLIHNIEVLGLPVNRAGELAGISSPHSVLTRPHVIAAREDMQKSIRARVNITKEDIIEGMREAIDVARTIGDPSAMIRGWTEVARLTGHDKPTQINVNVVGMTASQARKMLRAASDVELAKLAKQEDIIDADFYEV